MVHIKDSEALKCVCNGRLIPLNMNTNSSFNCIAKFLTFLEKPSANRQNIRKTKFSNTRFKKRKLSNKFILVSSTSPSPFPLFAFRAFAKSSVVWSTKRTEESLLLGSIL